MHRILINPQHFTVKPKPLPSDLALAAQMHGAERWHDAHGQRGRFAPPEIFMAEALSRRNWRLLDLYGQVIATYHKDKNILAPAQGKSTGKWRQVIAIAQALKLPLRVTVLNGAWADVRQFRV